MDSFCGSYHSGSADGLVGNEDPATAIAVREQDSSVSAQGSLALRPPGNRQEVNAAGSVQTRVADKVGRREVRLEAASTC